VKEAETHQGCRAEEEEEEMNFVGIQNNVHDIEHYAGMQ
jgi:hypothetical protein